MGLIFRGRLHSIENGKAQSGRPYRALQFLSERDDSGGLRVDKVFLPDRFDVSGFVEGEPIELAVTARPGKNGQGVTLSALLDQSEVQQAQARPAPRVVA